MRAGKLRQVVDIRRDAETGQDASGASIVGPVTVLSGVHVGINPGRGREYESAKQLHSDLSHVVTMRADPRLSGIPLNQCWFHVKPTRLNPDAARKLTILQMVNKDERGREFLVYCREDTF